MVIIGYSTVPEMKVQFKSLYLLGYFTKKCYYKPKESIKYKLKKELWVNYRSQRVNRGKA